MHQLIHIMMSRLSAITVAANRMAEGTRFVYRQDQALSPAPDSFTLIFGHCSDFSRRVGGRSEKLTVLIHPQTRRDQ
jgi:hypothetical protein